MKIIKIDIQNIILFTQILTNCFIEQSDFLVKDYNILDKENKINNDHKIKIEKFFNLLKKRDKVFMTLLFTNYNKKKLYFIFLFSPLFIN